jgi:hypothetical protein
MTPKQMTYSLDERQIGGIEGRIEWALKIWFDDNLGYVIHVWHTKPSEFQVEEMVSICLRAIDVYRRSFTIPQQPCATKRE